MLDIALAPTVRRQANFQSWVFPPLHFDQPVRLSRQDITPIVISSGEAHTLAVEPGTRGLHITRHYLDDQMKFLAVSINRYPNDRFRFLPRWKLS